MNIPKRYKIGGQWFEIKLHDLVDKGENHGNMYYCPPVLNIATKYRDDDGNLCDMTENQIENTIKHEILHTWQYMSGHELDEVIASTFAAFWCEYDETKEY